MDNIHFFTEGITFDLPNSELTLQWLSDILKAHNSPVENINFIFCSDDYLLDVNRSYLDHDYYTDIITFDNRDTEEEDLDSDIFLSIDRIKENASDLDVPFERELHRVIIHGILHLIGWNDKTHEQKQAMREKEEACLSLHPNYN